METPPVERFFLKYFGRLCTYDIKSFVEKFLANFYKNFHGSGGPWKLLCIFKVFKAYLGTVSITFSGSNILLISCGTHQNFGQKYFLPCKRGSKTGFWPIFTIFSFFELFVLTEAFDLGQWWFCGNLTQSLLFYL